MQIRYVAGSLAIASAMGFLVFTSLKAGTVKSIPVTDLRAKDKSEHSFVGQRLRVVGFVGAQPVKKTRAMDASGHVDVSHFEVVEGKDVVRVEYADTLPDTFRKGGPVQVDGVYTAPGVMTADHVLTKCPSKYEAGEEGMEGAKKTATPAEKPAAPRSS